MLILGVDTSGKNGSIALVRFDGESSQTLEVVPLEGGTFSAQLVPQISELLAKHNFSKRDIDAFAIVSGPGSFTGLRVGLAAIKALAEVLHKPIAAVSLLEVLLRASGLDGNLISVLDAGRGEVFARTCDAENHTVSEELLALAELQARAGATRVVTVDQKLADLLMAQGASVTIIPQPHADAVAGLGYQMVQSDETVTPETLDATYIRRSDAEIVAAGRTPK
jgi:tRNA threonylcarbamoyladenosine biosynthesis protein TsaB